MKSLPLWLVLIALPSLAAESNLAMPAISAPPPINAPAKGDKERGGFVFSLTPKSFQKEPILDFNVLTEMTAEGKKRAQPTAEAPQYCIIQGGGIMESGEISGAPKPPSPEAVRKLVVRAMAKRHYLEASEAGPKATLAIIYHWGTHESPAFVNETGAEDPSASANGDASDLMLRVLGDVQKRKILIDRAALVGGTKFAIELNASLNDEAAFRRTNNTGNRSAEAIGLSSLEVGGLLSPFHRFIERDAQTRRLVEESFGQLYFVIISAFDHDSVAASKPVLLWRTKMSLNSAGVSLVETIQPMISAGADYIGRETDGGILLARKLKRAGNVKIGAEEVLDYIEDASAPPTEKK